MSDKRELFENFISRMDSEIENGRYFEASWYVYALLEDRLISMLRNSGGVPQPTRGGRFLMLGGAKVTHLSQRMRMIVCCKPISTLCLFRNGLGAEID